MIDCSEGFFEESLQTAYTFETVTMKSLRRGKVEPVLSGSG